MKNIGRVLISFCMLCPSVLPAQNLQCPDIARTLKTYGIDNSSGAFLNSVFTQNCQQDGSRKSSGGGFGLDTLIKAVPVKFTGNYGSAEEGFTNFCRTYASLATVTTSKDSYKEYISDRALSTINQCLALQASGVQISHDMVNVESVSFYLRSSVTQSFQIEGVATTGNISCSGQVKGKTLRFDQDVNVPVKATQNFTCIRKSDSGASGTKLFGEATITILTNQGNYPVLLPRDERLPESMALALAEQIGALRSDLSTSNALLRTMSDAKPVPVFQCPVGWVRGGGPGGAWASYGCQGQISASSTCTDNVYPTGQTLTCSPLGAIRPY